MTPLRRRRRQPAKKPTVITRVAVGHCQLFATFAMPYPRCKVIVPAKTHHTCGEPRDGQ